MEERTIESKEQLFEYNAKCINILIKSQNLRAPVGEREIQDEMCMSVVL